MNIVIEFVVNDINKAASFYTKYFGFMIKYSQYEPVSWMLLKNENTELMLVTYDYTKNDIHGFKEYTQSTNLYKFQYDNLDKIKEIYKNLKKDNREIFQELREADGRYEFGVFNEDKNMIMVTKQLPKCQGGKD